ncbi:hypothetical protein K353_05022 [Kitasatospora sp. SolWspMP-SS2h]|nr:hypothetical protein K353_05022 [Kitasatospora sp. SolWspMP-SS2h]
MQIVQVAQAAHGVQVAHGAEDASRWRSGSLRGASAGFRRGLTVRQEPGAAAG